MSANAPENLDLEILDPEDNIGYLPKPIPVTRDGEILEFLSRSMRERSVAKLQCHLTDGHAMVLRTFAERIVSASVRNRSPEQLLIGLVALLLGMAHTDSREGLAILPLFYDAMLKLHVEPSAFADSARQAVGDRMSAPLAQFMSRADKTLEAMGYREGADTDGFRYVRNW